HTLEPSTRYRSSSFIIAFHLQLSCAASALFAADIVRVSVQKPQRFRVHRESEVRDNSALVLSTCSALAASAVRSLAQTFAVAGLEDARAARRHRYSRAARL